MKSCSHGFLDVEELMLLIKDYLCTERTGGAFVNATGGGSLPFQEATSPGLQHFMRNKILKVRNLFSWWRRFLSCTKFDM